MYGNDKTSIRVNRANALVNIHVRSALTCAFKHMYITVNNNSPPQSRHTQNSAAVSKRELATAYGYSPCLHYTSAYTLSLTEANLRF